MEMINEKEDVYDGCKYPTQYFQIFDQRLEILDWMMDNLGLKIWIFGLKR